MQQRAAGARVWAMGSGAGGRPNLGQGCMWSSLGSTRTGWEALQAITGKCRLQSQFDWPVRFEFNNIDI